MVWLAISIVAIPAIGCLLAVVCRRPVNAVLFGLIFVVAGGFDLYAIAVSNRSVPTPAPIVTQMHPAQWWPRMSRRIAKLVIGRLAVADLARSLT